MGYLYALAGALLFAANGSLTKLLVQGGLSPLQLTQFRTVGAAVLAAILLLAVERRGFRLRPRQLLVMALLGVVGVALVQACYALALQRLPVGITLLLEYTAVLLVALFAFLVFREKVRARLWIAIGCVLAGLAVVAQVWDSDLDALGVLFALGAAAALSLYFLVGERQVGGTSPYTVAFWTMTFATLFWLPFSGWWELSAPQLIQPLDVAGIYGHLDLPLWLPLLASVVLGSFVPYLLSFTALKHLPATAVGIVGSSEVVFSFLVAWIWLGEGLLAWQIVGALVVVAGIVLAQTARKGKVVDAELALPGDAGVGGRP